MSERRDAVQRILSVAGWKVLVVTRLRNGAVFDHSYEYLDGPHTGPVWNTLTSFNPSDRDHRVWIREHLEESSPAASTTADEVTT